MVQIQQSFPVEPSSIGQPKSYLGADFDKVLFRRYGWTMGAETYVTPAIKNLKK